MVLLDDKTAIKWLLLNVYYFIILGCLVLYLDVWCFGCLDVYFHGTLKTSKTSGVERDCRKVGTNNFIQNIRLNGHRMEFILENSCAHEVHRFQKRLKIDYSEKLCW